MTEEQLLEEVESYKYNSNLITEMVLRLFRDRKQNDRDM